MEGQKVWVGGRGALLPEEVGNPLLSFYVICILSCSICLKRAKAVKESKNSLVWLQALEQARAASIPANFVFFFLSMTNLFFQPGLPLPQAQPVVGEQPQVGPQGFPLGQLPQSHLGHQAPQVLNNLHAPQRAQVGQQMPPLGQPPLAIGGAVPLPWNQAPPEVGQQPLIMGGAALPGWQPPMLGGLSQARPRTFAALYGDPLKDPFQGHYEQVMNRFDPEVNSTISHIILMEQAVGNGASLQASLCCAQRQQQIVIYCLHLPSKYIAALDGSTTPWDGNKFMSLGEVHHNITTTVQIPDKAFRAITNVRVKTVEYILTHLDEIGDMGMPVVPVDDPDSVVVTTRQLMFLPAKYVPLLLRTTGYSPCEVWETLYPAIVDANDLAHCAAILKWLQVTSTQNGNGQPANLLALEAPLADEKLIAHRTQVLQQVLPALFQPADSLEQAITTMAAAVTHNTTDNRLAREQKAATALAPKLPSEKFSVTLPILQDYLNIEDERNLP